MSPVCDPISFRGAYLIERTLSRTTDVFICVSEEEKDHAQSLGISRDKIRVIPNGIPVWNAHESKSLRAHVRRELSLSETDICIGTVGRLVHQKASQVLIEAFGIAAPQIGNHVKLVVVGAGPMLARLEALAKSLSVRNNIYFAGELPGLRTMAAFDIFALSSCYEGHPYTFIEALSMGLPIVTTAIGGAKMSVMHNANGFVSPIGDAKAMAGNLVKLANSPGLREEMSRASFKIAAEFSLENMLRRTSEAYESTMQTRSYLAQTAGAGR
jgi:glycosyltransferase involved in cell wall biosynthesis